MLLEALRDFEWYNEPREVSFSDRGVKITASPHTDFWQDTVRAYHKDDGHFFYGGRRGAFMMTASWRFDNPGGFAQCGLMGRLDERNWFKIAVMSRNSQPQNIGTVVTVNGNSDMALVSLEGAPADVWFRVRKSADGIYELAYSVNGIVFAAVRRFRLGNESGEIDAGVYICSPSEQAYTALLSSIENDTL